MIVLGMTLLLVLLWPHKRRHAVPAQSMPEASASYVLLEGFYGVLSGNALVGGNRWPVPVDAMLVERENMALRRLPLPEYAGLGVLSPWAPEQPGFPSNSFPNLAARPVADVLTGLPPATNSLTISLSPGLQRSGFAFEVPPGAMTGMPMVAQFHLELDDKGDVIHVLAEPGDNPDIARLLETAINRGRGTSAGRGQLQIMWGK